MRAPLLAALLGCEEPPPPGELVFVRGGVIAPSGEGRALPGGRVLVERAWTPGDRVSLGGLEATAPQMAECLPLFHAPLGDVSRLIAMGGEAPDTALAWSPDATRLAVGAYTGELVVVDGWSGQEIARERLAETMVKRLAWSADGRTLYAAEQSPDAFLWALDPDTLAPRWKLRLADVVGSSAPPAGEDLYGVYTLPAAFGLSVLPDGDLLVAASHGWNEADGARRNRGRLLRVRPDGTIADGWPDQAVDVVFLEPRLDLEGGLLVVPVNHTASDPPPADLPVGGAAVLRIEDLSLVTSVTPEPLKPWFQTAYLWDALDVDAASGTLLLGLGDGRVLLHPLVSGGEVRALTPGTPIRVGDVPISASVGFGLLHEDSAVFITSNTNIPYGAAAPDLRPPSAHPGENAVWVHGLDGELRWTWRGEQRVAGLAVGADGRTLVVGAGPRVSDDRQDLFGAMLFDLGGPTRSGEERLLAFCGTESPVFFRFALSADGRLALAEVPTQGPDGETRGTYRLTVLR